MNAAMGWSLLTALLHYAAFGAGVFLSLRFIAPVTASDSWRQTVARAIVATVCGFLIAACATISASAEQYPSLTGLVENHIDYDFGGATSNIGRQITWINTETDLSLDTTVVASVLNYNEQGLFDQGTTSFDETYIEHYVGNDRFRIGRIRSAFGFSDWSELYYQGLPRLPLVRDYPSGGGLDLDRVDAGAEWQTTKNANQLTVAVIDANSGKFELLPEKINHVAVRLQSYQGAFIVGLNALQQLQYRSEESQLYGFDLRWSSPHIQIRSEWDYDFAQGYRSQGSYTDITYHPPGLLRTTFIGRFEQVSGVQSSQYDSEGDPECLAGTAYTLGIKQILNPYLTLELSHTWNASGGNLPSTDPYTLELMTFTRF